MKKFADDTKMASIVDNQTQSHKLQDQLNALSQWSKIWQMSFNTDKCVVMHLGNNNMSHEYQLDGVGLKVTECEKDIGVYVQPSLKPSHQIAESVKKANRALGMLLRNLTFRDKYHYIKLYKTYVRCHLEYAVQAWNPWLLRDIENLESVQKRAIKHCHGLSGSYEEKLKSVGLTTLSERRLRGDMIQTFKVMHGIDDVDASTWFTRVGECHQRTRQAVEVRDDGEVVQELNLIKPKCKLEVRRNFFSCRVVDPWNLLPSDVQGAADVDVFKERYDKFIAGTVRQ